MKGIILAGGNGTRLYPLTKVLSKQLLPVYDKPMVYYPLSLLMEAEVREILIISTDRRLKDYADLLGNGIKWGIHIQYMEQPSPDGIPQAFILAEKFIGNDSVFLILGDNVILGESLDTIFTTAIQDNDGATCFAYTVSDPERFGIVTLDKNGIPISIEEKPKDPCSHFAVPGIYIVDKLAVACAKGLRPSARKELEITDLLREYMNRGKLRAIVLDEKVRWIDAGTPESLFEASEFIRSAEEQSKCIIGCPEAIAYRKGWISKEQLNAVLNDDRPSYGDKLRKFLNLEIPRLNK